MRHQLEYARRNDTYPARRKEQLEQRQVIRDMVAGVLLVVAVPLIISTIVYLVWFCPWDKIGQL